MDRTKPRRRLRFRLRHLLVAIAVAAIGLSVVAMRIRQYESKAAKLNTLRTLCNEASADYAMRTVAPSQASSFYSPPIASEASIWDQDLATWLAWLRGDFSSVEVNYLSLSADANQGDAVRAVLAYLRNFPELRHVVLDSNAVADNHVRTLVESCPQLTRVAFASTKVTDALLPYIARLEGLQQLDLRYTNYSGEGIQSLLDACPDLYDLTLHESQLTADAVETLSQWQSKKGYVMRPFDNGSLSVFDPKRF